MTDGPDQSEEAFADEPEEQYEDLTCRFCGGDGCDALETFMPCKECDGEGYRWWE